MIKPPPSGAIPGVTDTLDFVKNLWGSMNIPGTGMPGMANMAGAGLSTEDLDKRIADMKAVEAWLNLNLTMLRGTIQGMEVQRSTLATLKTMGASMAEMMRQSGVSAENMANTPFASFFGQPAQGAAASGSTSSSAADKAGAAAGGGSAQPGAAGAGPAQAGAAALPGADAAMAWWNMLQDQFTQAVTTAMAPAPGAASAPAAKAAGSPEGGGGGEKAAAPQAQPSSTPQPDAGNAAPENGGGKGRSGKPKADKG